MCIDRQPLQLLLPKIGHNSFFVTNFHLFCPFFLWLQSHDDTYFQHPQQWSVRDPAHLPLDEEKSKCAGLAQEIGFDRLVVNGIAKAAHLPDKSVRNVI